MSTTTPPSIPAAPPLPPHAGNVRVAAVQAAPYAFDLFKSLHKLRSLVFAARENGADLVVLPEAFLSAYPRHLDFRVGSRSEENREWYARYVKSSVKIPPGAEGHDYLATSPEQAPGQDYWAFQQLSQIARKYTLYLSVGVVECSNVGSTLWCTNLLFGPNGVLLSKHRKLQPTAAERVVWSQGEATNPTGLKRERDGEPGTRQGTDNMPVVASPVGKIGGLICWENFMPLARYVLYKKGVEIYLAPTADGRPTWLPVMQHIAQEGRCFVITANQYHASTDFPIDYPPNVRAASGHVLPGSAGASAMGNASASTPTPPSETKTTHHGGDMNIPIAWSRGGSAIIGPLGDVLAGPLWDKEGIIYADIDLGDLLGAKLDFDPIGHYSREELLMDLLNHA